MRHHDGPNHPHLSYGRESFSWFLGFGRRTDMSDSSKIAARAFLRSAQDRLCPRALAGAGRPRDSGRDARATSDKSV